MPRLPARRAFLHVSLAVALAAITCSPAALASSPAPRLVQVDVYDRTTAQALSVYAKDGRSYIVGVPGHEYAIRIRNCTGGRVLAVTSVDGVNVVTGDTAAPGQSGYVIEPWGSVEIAGWRKSTSSTAAFFFSEHAQSYAARTGRPFDVGVIGVAAFSERLRPAVARIAGERDAARTQADEARANAPAPAAPEAAGAAAEAQAPALRQRAEAAPLAKLGTGHGRGETSYVRQVAFERATVEPGEIVAVQYDRRENLVALGVIEAPPRYAHTPRPFPGMRFVPDPR